MTNKTMKATTTKTAKTVAGGEEVAVSTRIADDFTSEEIARQRDATVRDLVAAEARWPGLVSLEGAERAGNLGRLIAVLDPQVRALFDAITPVPGEAEAKAASKAKLAAILNTTLGDEDHGKDPKVFEVDVVLRRLDRIEAQQQIVAKIDALRKVFADDILNTGTMVVEPALKALDVARSLAGGNAEFRSLLAPLTNSLSDMTKAARMAQQGARTAAKNAAPAGKGGGGEAPVKKDPAAE